MKKFYLKNGKEVRIGDIIRKSFKIKHPIFGVGKGVEEVLVTEEALTKLIDSGDIIVKNIDNNINNNIKDVDNHINNIKNPKQKSVSTNESSPIKEEVPMELQYYIYKIANKLKWKVEKVNNYICNLYTIYPAAAFSLILKEIAIELDKRYKDSIEDSPEIYAISVLNGKIGIVDKATIKNYRNFAAFRSVNDARIACKITKDILKEMFRSGK